MKINKKQLRGIVTEEVTKLLSEVLLNENAQSKREKLPRRAIIKYYKEYNGSDINEKTLQSTFDEIRRKFPNIRLPQDENRLWCYSWSPAVIRMYLSGALNNQKEQSEMNEILKYLSEEPEFAKQYDSELNHETIEQLSTKIMPLIDKKETDSTNRITAKHNAEKQSGKQIESDYTVVKIPDFETARQYAKYMDASDGWCITHSERMYDQYTQDGDGLFYFFLKNGFENVPEQVGENAPLDEYGLSMIAVCVDEYGKIQQIVSRWNHEHGGGDNVMTKEQLEEITHLDPSVVCPPYTDAELFEKGITSLESVVDLIKKGESPISIFQDYVINGEDNNILYVKLNKKWYSYNQYYNTLDEEGQDDLYEYSPKSIIIPDTLSEIKSNTFYYCLYLKKIVIPSSIEHIKEWALGECERLTSITIPNSVKYIGEAAFACCKSLTSITIPNGISQIEEYTFADCERALHIEIPNSVISIGDRAFENCNSLTSITIPDSVTHIGKGSFNGCTSLTSIIIPNSVKFIGTGAFYGCTNVTSVTIGNSIISIGDKAFLECPNLKTVYFENINIRIKDGVFPEASKFIFSNSNETNKNNISNQEENQSVEELNEVRERFNDLLKRMNGLFI